MGSNEPYASFVDAWLHSLPNERRSEELVVLFERALQAVWERAQRTLGDVTLEAIGERVLYHAVAKYPAISRLALEPSGFHCRELRDGAQQLDKADMQEGLRFVLVRFLAILGSLTADILTNALREELSKVGLDLGEGSQPSPTAGTSAVKEVKS